MITQVFLLDYTFIDTYCQEVFKPIALIKVSSFAIAHTFIKAKQKEKRQKEKKIWVTC